MLYLGRLMLNPGGLASNAAFQQLGRPLIETSNLYYDGNSQGGIEGGMLTALSPDFRHAVLGVTGIDYANVLVQRSTDFAPFGTLLYAAYPDPSLHPLLLDLMQQLWDRGEPDGYAEQMTTHPLPDTPSHQVLMQLAYGDHQVSMYAGAIEARTVGASAYQPALDLSTNRAQDRNLFYGIPAIKGFPFNGSAVEIWDSGPGHTSPPPLTNTPPAETTTGDEQDPHEDPRNTPAAQQQISDFLTPTGAVTNVCGGTPCRSSDYTPVAEATYERRLAGGAPSRRPRRSSIESSCSAMSRASSHELVLDDGVEDRLARRFVQRQGGEHHLLALALVEMVEQVERLDPQALVRGRGDDARRPALGQLGEQAAEVGLVLEHERDLEHGLVVHRGHRGGDRLVAEVAHEPAHRHVLASRHELGGDLPDERGRDRGDEV